MPRLKLLLGRLFAGALPRLAVANGLDVNNLSRDAAAVAAFCRDPRVHDRISLQTAAMLLDTGAEIRGRTQPAIAAPVLLAHGTADTMTSHAASAAFYERLAGAEKSFMSLPGAYHERTRAPRAH